MDSNILERNVYTGLRQGQGPEPIAVADLRGVQGMRTPRVQILLISCSFWEILAKSYVGTPQGVGTPSSGKSWICHCIVSYCSSSTPCIGPVPGPVQYTKPLEVTFLMNLFCSNTILAELAELKEKLE